MRNAPPAPLARNVACLDYGLGKGGGLVACRWDGKREIRRDKFISTN